MMNMRGEGGGVAKGGACKQTEPGQVGWAMVPPLLRLHFYLPGIVVISALGHIIPEQKVL